MESGSCNRKIWLRLSVKYKRTSRKIRILQQTTTKRWNLWPKCHSICNKARINIAAHRWRRKRSNHLSGISGAKLSHRKRRLNFNYWRKCWNLEESIIKRGGGATFDLGAWTGKGEQSAVSWHWGRFSKFELLKFS